jgi:hypothetical protein
VTFSGWGWGATGETIFEHTRAGLRDPHFGLRGYRDDPVPGTLSKLEHSDPNAPGSDQLAGAPNGKHKFLDVAFGEHVPVFTWFNVNPRRSRYARGVEFNVDGAVFMLLDYDAQSSGLIDADFRIGGSIDFRPWWGWLENLSLSVGGFHESTHLGDEYVLSAATIQGHATPTANALLPYRANPSYLAVPATLSLDIPFGDSDLSARFYGGVSTYFQSQLPNGKFPSEWRAGGELRWTSQDGANERLSASEQDSFVDRALANIRRRSTGARPGEPVRRPPRWRRRRGAFGLEGAYELLAKRQYEHVGPEPGPATFVSADGYWYIQHALIMGLYNLDTERSTSNAFGLSIEWIHGRSPYGQLTEYARTDTFAIGLSYYW